MARRTTRLPDDVRDLLRRGYGLFTNAEARATGITHSRLHRLTQAELLTHLAHGCYVETSRFESLDEWNQFGEKARAFAVSCGPATTSWAGPQWSTGACRHSANHPSCRTSYERMRAALVRRQRLTAAFWWAGCRRSIECSASEVHRSPCLTHRSQPTGADPSTMPSLWLTASQVAGMTSAPPRVI